MKDLSFLSDVEAVVAAPMAITGENSGRAALAQRVMTMLLSSVDDPARTYTTGLLQHIGRSNIRSGEDLANDFTFATTSVRAIIEAEQSSRTDLTDEDTLQEIVVESIDTDGDTVSAVLQIVTVAGEAMKLSFEI